MCNQEIVATNIELMEPVPPPKVLLQPKWNPGAKRWSHSGNCGTGWYIDTRGWKYVAPYPLPIIANSTEDKYLRIDQLPTELHTLRKELVNDTEEDKYKAMLKECKELKAKGERQAAIRLFRSIIGTALRETIDAVDGLK